MNRKNRENTQKKKDKEVGLALPQILSGNKNKIVGFTNVCKSYIGLKLRNERENVRISWMLTYIQGKVVEN